MRNLNGFLKILLLSIYSILFSTFFFSNSVFAQQGFQVYSDFYYIWHEDYVDSTIYLTITTDGSSRAITYYTITIPDENIVPEIYSINRDTKLDPTIHRRTSATDIVVDLDNLLLTNSKPITLKITFKTPVSDKQLSLISSVTNTTTRTFSFTYPSSKGEITWISAPIQNIKSVGDSTEVITTPQETNRVNLAFGEEILYKFQINRNLTNSGDQIISSEISLPLNNNKQHIVIEKVLPQPDKSYKDRDDNYILQYEVAPQSNIEVSVEGYLLMSKSTYDISYPDIENFALWEIKDDSLKRHINRYLKEYGLNISESFSKIDELTTEAEYEVLYKGIYQYVITNLEPNTLTLGSLSGSERIGGQQVLINQSVSTSEDYADAIISLYRYHNIPARLVIGYVTNISQHNSEDIYHYWAEYYDKTKKDWILVDPFLEDFSKISLWGRDMPDHISLIYRNSNPNSPKLFYFTKEDFSVEIEKGIPEITYEFDADFSFTPYKLLDPYLQGSITLSNKGNTILDSFLITKSNPEIDKYIDYIENNNQVALLPGQTYQIKFNIPSNKVESNIFAVIEASSGTEVTEGKYIEKEISLIDDNNNLKIFSKLLSILLFFISAIPIYYLIRKLEKKNG
ncbi:MAG: hypothetical protein UR34_C0005G0017 [candidate division WS6 bacterium GW2011_GWC1_33_20]|uniref:Transglutaminase-like domain-containing protein n=2 Tax=Candidatus Dojkabacteria TaxID=74243 RepID=A0A0G0AEW6_9BACT|nr:MAG: hypothetical protein UR32_C0002G0011 [candidate division WS6 bacterium GW2011_GWE2_33_157]KKP44194.1 MAG: hypothetical protein UR34_C0005G0017 [candidate division WS6 bacterium GW2011_GWC1_33_20]KKP45750.1 MAG: hypothetical protein UR36_C0004G0011 [candidate division WS6 bacterium GW2011_GWF1_33_233]KKP55088.1 MAG: hypothetical protein UR47_C0005G0017 [candidate division WS6 bacterium GW2011_GWB1_33_6]KKP55193.1 MAG: hypothetical protein UR45_C0003G0011 [candidate division WS6 bacterium